MDSRSILFQFHNSISGKEVWQTQIDNARNMYYNSRARRWV